MNQQVLDMLANIHKINLQFTNKEWVLAQQGEVLSYTALKLAALKGYLIEEKEAAHKAALKAEIEADNQKALAYKRAMAESNATAAKDAKYSDPEFIEAREKYVEAKVYYEKLKSIVADSHDLIEAIRSRVIDMHGARKDESIK